MKNIVNKKTFLSTYNYKIFGMRELNKYGYWFPLNPSTELAEVIANLLTDGHLASKKLKNRRTFDYISFFSDEDKELKHFQKKIERLFNIKSKRRYWGKRYNSRSRGVIICNSSLERTLMLCGVPLGDKTIIEFNVPKWIKNSNKKIQASFFLRLFR